MPKRIFMKASFLVLIIFTFFGYANDINRNYDQNIIPGISVGNIIIGKKYEGDKNDTLTSSYMINGMVDTIISQNKKFKYKDTILIGLTINQVKEKFPNAEMLVNEKGIKESLQFNPMFKIVDGLIVKTFNGSVYQFMVYNSK
jgi:hypothetical protein